jgi:hypothetical protein
VSHHPFLLTMNKLTQTNKHNLSLLGLNYLVVRPDGESDHDVLGEFHDLGTVLRIARQHPLNRIAILNSTATTWSLFTPTQTAPNAE